MLTPFWTPILQAGGSVDMRSPFSAASYQSPGPYASPAHPFASRAHTSRRPACEDVLFFEVPHYLRGSSPGVRLVHSFVCWAAIQASGLPVL